MALLIRNKLEIRTHHGGYEVNKKLLTTESIQSNHDT